jgi:hypothetical protein
MAWRNPLPESGRGRKRLLAVALVVFVSGVVVLLGARPQIETPTAGIGLDGPGSVPIAARFPAVTTSTRPRPTTTRPSVARSTTPNPRPSTTAPVDLVSTPPASGPPATSAPVPVPVPTTGPRTLMLPAVTATLPPPPPSLGANVLTWTAPASLDVAAGATAALAVTAHNPTDRNVDLPHPLSCTPRLDHAETCAPEVQRIAAHASASATYTIDAHGIAPGQYTLSIEGVLTVAVTVS